MRDNHKFVQTGSFKTGYYEGGAGDETVILIHGGGAGADAYGNWRTCFPYFAERSRVLAMDMVGFGTSDAPDPASFQYTTDARIAQTIAFIEAVGQGNKPVHLVGNSMGGSTALGVAMKRPELLKNIVLMGSAGLNREVNAALQPMVNYDFTLEGMRRIVGVLANPAVDMPEELLRYRYELSIRPQTQIAYKAIMAWVKAQGGLHYADAQIASVKTRALVFAGKDDMVIPMRDNYHFLELLDNSTGYFLPHCRHWAMLEYPEIFSRVTLDFLLGDEK